MHLVTLGATSRVNEKLCFHDKFIYPRDLINAFVASFAEN